MKDYLFIIPTVISIIALFLNYLQRRKVIELEKSLEKKNLVHKIQFEKEFSIYSELWAKLIELRNSTANLRPFLERLGPETEKEMKTEKLEKMAQIFDEAIYIFDNNRPFYSAGVYDEINEIFKISRDEMFEFKYLEMSDRRKAQLNVDKIIYSMDTICDIIRKRIDFVEIIN